jgi:hypothetical protein
VGPEILSTPLPDTVIGWVGLLISIWAALLTVLGTVEKFVERYGPGSEVLRPYGGLALPVGWGFWCIALLIAHHDPIAVLVVLLGTSAITIAAQALVRRCRA